MYPNFDPNKTKEDTRTDAWPLNLSILEYITRYKTKKIMATSFDIN